MANKKDALGEILSLVNKHQLSENEVMHVIRQGKVLTEQSKLRNYFSLLSLLGLIFMASGVSIFLGLNWELLAYGTKCWVGLCFGLVCCIFGVLLKSTAKAAIISIESLAYLAGLVYLGIGLYCFLKIMVLPELGTIGEAVIISATLWLISVSAYGYFKSSSQLMYVAILFTITCVNLIYYFSPDLILELRLLIAGTILFTISHLLIKTKHESAVELLSSLAIVSILSGLMMLLYEESFDALFLIPNIVFLVYGLVYHIKSSALITIAAFIVFIIYYCGTHFSDKLGWPVLLVLLGVFFILLAYGSIRFYSYFRITK